MSNKELKDYIRGKGVFLWQVAAKLGISDITFTKRMRFQLPEKERMRILAIVEELVTEKAHETEVLS